jgi:peptidoglycan/LPS O-acetylase OafA/YrhL
MLQSSKTYLPNLNSIRAFAAVIVIVSHIELRKELLGINGISAIFHWGKFGVDLFFVLSGFLITFLLLTEKEKIKTIDVRSFYIRRALRIWPLYFLILFFTYFLIPYILPEYYHSNINRFTPKSLILNILMLTNITLIIKLTPLIISTIWSIGIEEQFYLFWPWVIKCKEKKYIKIIVFFIFFIPLGKIFLMGFIYFWDIPFLKILSHIVSTTRFDCMAIGAFFGVLAYRKQIKISLFTFNYYFFSSKKIQYTSYSLLIFFFIISHFTSASVIQSFSFLFYPTLFGISILNLATNPNTIFKLENKVTNYIGKISYSLYLTHMLVIYLLPPILKPLIVNHSITIKNIIIYTITLISTLTISYITYNLYEKRFVLLKRKYSHIKT